MYANGLSILVKHYGFIMLLNKKIDTNSDSKCHCEMLKIFQILKCKYELFNISR